MLKGTTESGFEYEVTDAALNNFELIEALAGIEESPLLVPRVVQLLLGTEQKKALYDHCRAEDGTVPSDVITEELVEIFKGGQELKN